MHEIKTFNIVICQRCGAKVTWLSYCLLGVLWKSEAEVDDRQSSKLFPKIEHLRVSVVLELHTLRDLLTGPAVRRQVKALAAVTETRVAAHRVHTLPLTHTLLTLVHIWINKSINTNPI